MIKYLDEFKVQDGWAATPPSRRLHRRVRLPGETTYTIGDKKYVIPNERVDGPEPAEWYVYRYAPEGAWSFDLQRVSVGPDMAAGVAAVRLMAGDVDFGFGIPDEKGVAVISTGPVPLTASDVLKSPLRIILVTRTALGKHPEVKVAEHVAEAKAPADEWDCPPDRMLRVESPHDTPREYCISNGEMCYTWRPEPLFESIKIEVR